MPSIYILLNEKTDFEELAEGRALSNNYEYLKGVADQLGIKGIFDFFCETPDQVDEMRETWGDGPWTEYIEHYAEKWYDPNEGLSTFRALRTYIGDYPEECTDSDAVISELIVFESVLSQAGQRGLKWHSWICD